MTCPNKSLLSWKKLDELVPSISYYVWNKLNGEVDDNGHPIKNKEVFDKILEKSGNDFKSSYIQFVGDGYKSIEEIEEESKTIEKQSLINEQEVKDIELSETPELTHSEKTLTDHLSKLDRMGELREKAIKALQVKLQLRKKKFTESDIRRAEEYIKKLSELESEQALIDFTKQANKVVNRYYKEYLNVKQQLKDIQEGKSDLKKEDIWNPSILHKWRDYLAAYNVVDDFRNQLLREGRLDNQPEIKAIINNVIEKKDLIRELYEVEGKDMDAEFLAQNYNKLYIDNKILATQEYEKLDDSQKAKITKEEFIRAQKEMHNEDIQEQTKSQIKQELTTANRDISTIGRWMDTVADVNDAPTIAAYKTMAIADYKTNASFIETRDKTVDLLRDLEDFQKVSNKKKLYDFMIELDSKGKQTGKIVNKFGGGFWDEYQNLIDDLNEKNITGLEYKQAVSQWKKVNAPLQTEKFNKAKWENINNLKQKGLLTDEEMENIHWNETVSRTPMTYHELAEQNLISDNAADELSEWISSNVWDFREPSEKWKKLNPQWDKLNNILHDENDPRTKYYKHYVDYIDEKNSQLPYNQRLPRYQIPSILKTTEEQIADKESIGTIAKTILSKKFDVLDDDMDRTNSSITDEEGNIRHFIPIYYTGKLKKYVVKDKSSKVVKEFRTEKSADKFINDKKNKAKGYTIEIILTPEDQSYDLSTILLRFTHMSDNYKNKAEIFPEMELTKFFINTRDVANTDSKGNIIKSIAGVFTKDKETVKPRNETNLAQFFNDWYEMAMYGIKEKDQGTILGFDVAKTVNFLNSFTSLNLLAVNVRAGLNNVILGEALQTAEAFAHEYMSSKSYTKANGVFYSNIPSMMEDIGSRKPKSLINKLYEHFNLPTESLNPNLKDNSKFKMLGKKSTLYFVMHFGDFYMQSRMFLGMLENMRAYDNNGKDIGSMLDMYRKHFKETGEVGLPKEVNLVKSNWTQKDKDNFTIKTRGVLSGIHGEYGELERNAIQRVALGRMAIMFRKFIVPGIRKRYKKYAYSERLGDYTEGYYRTLGKFLTNLSKELGTVLFHIQSEKVEFNAHQKANITRAFTEAAFLVAAIVLASIVLGKLKDGDDDDKFVYSWAAYQLLRFKSELLFYTPKIDEALSILRSPMASMSMFENITKTTHQLGVDLVGIVDGTGPERYVRGPRKDQYKMQKVLYDWIPVARSMSQLIYTQESLNLMNQSMVKKH